MARKTPKLSLLLALAPVVAGCTASYYRRDADRQVYRLLEDREARVLDYQPEVVAGPEEGAAELDVPRAAYEEIPATRLPPEVPPPLIPSDLGRPRKPLGPPAPQSGELSRLPAETLLLELREVERRYVGGLRLGPTAPEAVTPVEIGLFDGIRYAVRYNRDYRGRMEDLYLAALDVTLERHLFRPRPFAGGDIAYSRDVSPSDDSADYESALVATANAGVRQQLPYGGEIIAEAVVDFVDALDGNVQQGEDADLVLRASVPLLRGAGMVNLEPLIGAERSLVYEVRDFEQFRRSFAVEGARRYFNLVTSKSRVRNRYRRYLSALQLVDRAVNFFAADEFTALEVQRAQQQALSAEDSLNNAEQDYAADLDNFKLFLGMDVDTPIEIVEVDLELPDVEVDTQELQRQALALRLDLQTARDQVHDAQRRVSNARNGLLPDLDLNVRGDLGSDPGDPAARITGDSAGFTAGASLDLPLDRLRERNILRASLINLDRAARRVNELEDRVVADVRNSLRRLESARTSLRIQQENIDVAIERLDLANQLLETGRSDDSRNVVEAQNALLQAQDAFEQAQAEFQIAVLNLMLDSGTLRVNPEAGTLGRAMWRGDLLDVNARGEVRNVARDEIFEPDTPVDPVAAPE